MTSSVNHIAPRGHPLWILMEEHAFLLNTANKRVEISKMISSDPTSQNIERKFGDIIKLVQLIKDSPTHYLREENVIFPYAEKHGITGPPKMMWNEHNQIRGIEKSLFELIEEQDGMDPSEFSRDFEKVVSSLAELLTVHFQKENLVLFPAVMQRLSADEFASALQEFQDIGYCTFTPGVDKPKDETGARGTEEGDEAGLIDLQTGKVSSEQITAMLNTLPVEITFIDENDAVCYFSKPKDAIFTRTKAVLGRKVELCHPEKSVHLVKKIVSEFKSGKKEKAEFWIKMGEKYVYIRYFPVRDAQGKYLGCMEVTQDIADIQRISGERRLLDWD